MADGTVVALGPGSSKRRLRHELRRAREAAGLTQEQSAHAMDWHLSKILRIEAGTSGVAVTDVRALLRLYQVVDPDMAKTMIAWARKAKQASWWSAYKKVAPHGFLYYVGLESEAVAMRHFQDSLIPGLLQCEDYARAILADHCLWRFDDDQIDQRVALRLRRQQEAFYGARQLQVTTVLDEAVLRRTVGDSRVMKEELEHLLALTERPYLRIHILPFAIIHRPVHGGGFTILEFDKPDDAVVYTESGSPRGGEDTMQRVREVDAHRRFFQMILSAAADVEESQRIIQAAADDHADGR